MQYHPVYILHVLFDLVKHLINKNLHSVSNSYEL